MLERLCETAGVIADVAGRIANGLLKASQADADSADAPLMPHSVAELVWLDIDADAVQRLAPYVVLLPARTPVNVNTASREVLAAVIDDLDLATAERLVQVRQRTPFTGHGGHQQAAARRVAPPAGAARHRLALLRDHRPAAARATRARGALAGRAQGARHRAAAARARELDQDAGT